MSDYQRVVEKLVVSKEREEEIYHAIQRVIVCSSKDYPTDEKPGKSE